MNIRLVDASLSDVRSALDKYAKTVIKKKKKRDPDKTPLWVIMNRGDIEMKNGEWLKNESLAKELNSGKITLSQADLVRLFDSKNLNMGILGYGDPKDGLKGLMTWVKHNVNPKRLNEDKRDLNIKIESIKCGKKKNKFGVQLILRVPEKGKEFSKDLENVKLKNLGYTGLKSWTEDQLEKLKDSDKKLDKVIYKILSGEAKLKDKVEEVIKK